MVCMCLDTMAGLESALAGLGLGVDLAASANLDANLDVSLDASLDVDVGLSADADLLGLIARWLAKFGLPAAPWQPDPAWLDVELPTLSLSASAMATISAFAQLRASVQATLGIDLLVTAQAKAFTRLAATLGARLDALLAADASAGAAASALASASASAGASALQQLSATLSACAQVQAALNLGLLPAPPPPGPPLALWRPFLVKLRPLLPLISASSQLGVDLSADISAQLAATLRVIMKITLPAFPLPSLQVMASLTATLSAVANINETLGVDASAVGVAQIRAMVQARVQALAGAVASSTGLDLAALLALLNRLPRPEFSAALMAPAVVVKAALSINAQALAALTGTCRRSAPCRSSASACRSSRSPRSSTRRSNCRCPPCRAGRAATPRRC